MRRLLPALLLLATPSLPGGAFAQERPTVTPTRDVSVVYRVTGTMPDGRTETGEMRMSWLTAQGLLRMDMPGGQGWMLVDTRNNGGFMVMEQMRAILALPPGSDPSRRLSASQTARFTREGSDRVANVSCTNWRVEDRGEQARMCVTDDGVVVRSSGGPRANGGTLEALRVEYGGQDPARFRRPEGYQNVQIPGASQGTPSGQSFPGQRGSALPPPGLNPPSR
ncbi:MAG: DUF4412 domain-containing protein [Acetobacteraceae bacterium]|nr:DUF4412 domain-containing protein [Acetobacteraceae bacterium]